MIRRSAVLAAAALISAATAAHAEKIPQGFRTEFEKTFKKGRTFAVVMQEGVPTTSIYGVKGDSSGTAHFSIDIRDGAWKQSAGILDFDQTAADFLNHGEVMEMASISWKDDRVDMRMVSVESHKVTRGSLFKSTNREPVATNFKFFFPFSVSGAADVPQAIEYVEEFLKPFQTEREARAYAARVLAGEPQRASASRPRPRAESAPAAAATTTKKEIKVGMTALEVVETLGKPQKEIAFENKTRWTYPDVTVIFENGRVKEVKF